MRLPSSAITCLPFFEETNRVIVGMSNGPMCIPAAATSKAGHGIHVNGYSNRSISSRKLIPACTFATSFDAPIAPGGAYETEGEGRTMAMSLAPCPGSITRQVITELPEPDV